MYLNVVPRSRPKEGGTSVPEALSSGNVGSSPAYRGRPRPELH